MKKFIISLYLVVFFVSCSNEYKLRCCLEDMERTPFCLQTERMVQWLPDSLGQCEKSKAEVNIVVYADSTDCTSCYIGKLKKWNEYLSVESETKGKVSFLFIMEVNANQLNIVKSALNTSSLKHSVYLDTLSFFRHANPQLPDVNFFHTFVLNNENKVIFVGNPLQDEKIEVMFNEILEKERKQSLLVQNNTQNKN